MNCAGEKLTQLILKVVLDSSIRASYTERATGLSNSTQCMHLSLCNRKTLRSNLFNPKYMLLLTRTLFSYTHSSLPYSSCVFREMPLVENHGVVENWAGLLLIILVIFFPRYIMLHLVLMFSRHVCHVCLLCLWDLAGGGISLISYDGLPDCLLSLEYSRSSQLDWTMEYVALLFCLYPFCLLSGQPRISINPGNPTLPHSATIA